MKTRSHIMEQLRALNPALQKEFPLQRLALIGSWVREGQTFKPELLSWARKRTGYDTDAFARRFSEACRMGTSSGVGPRNRPPRLRTL